MIFFGQGILFPKGVRKMKVTGWAVTMGLGAAAGAVAVLMMPKSNPTRKLAAKAANKVEGAVVQMTDKMADNMDM